MYKVIKSFGDKEDNYFVYREGDIYPREGQKVSEERCKELASSSNRMGEPLIKKVQKK